MHSFYGKVIPDSLEVIAHSDICHNQTVRHIERPIYGFQAHPEIQGEHGKKIMQNFLNLTL